MRKILCSADFSKASEAAFPYAKVLALNGGAEVYLLHVIEPYILPIEYGLAPMPYAEIEDEIKTNTTAQLEKIAKKYFRGVKTKTLIRWGLVSSTILDLTKREKIDLIVMGTHGRTGLSHVFLGSTAEKIVRLASCPVLTVRSKASKS